MYDSTDAVENLRQTREVADLFRKAGMNTPEANTLAILGGLPGTNGQALRQTAQAANLNQPLVFDSFRQLALGQGGQSIHGSPVTVEEAYARLAALGYDPSIPPVAFHCREEGCHARAQLMIDRLQQLGLGPNQIRRAWAFAERVFDPKAPKLRPTTEAGTPLHDPTGVDLEWDYHLAPVVLGKRATGTPEFLVIDPSLFGHPTDVLGWHHRIGTPLHRPLVAQVTELGVAPIHPATGIPFPGTGYRPWADPHPLTPTQDAVRVMLDLMAPDGTIGRPARPLPAL